VYEQIEEFYMRLLDNNPAQESRVEKIHHFYSYLTNKQKKSFLRNSVKLKQNQNPFGKLILFFMLFKKQNTI